MKISQKTTYKSIVAFAELELPNFTIITGVNGSGKTHLLEGLKSGKLLIDGIVQSDGSIQYYSAQTLLAQLEPKTAPVDAKKRRVEAVKSFIRIVDQHSSALMRWASNHQITGSELLSDLNWLASAEEAVMINTIETSCVRLGNSIPQHQSKTIVQSLITQRKNAEQNILINIRQYGDLAAIIKDHATSTGKGLLALSEEDVRDALPMLWNPNDKLSLKFSEWFAAYHIAWERNRMYRFYAESNGENFDWKSDEEFERLYGPKPWKLANEVFEKCGAPYRFEGPSFTVGSDEDYVLPIRNSENLELKLDVPDLSTGEKLLLSIISFLYRATGSRTLAQLPKVLLLDEVDSPLHPGFTKQLISILHETLVCQCGVKVILVTHSPSTVALAPENCIYELQKNPRTLVHVSRAQAVDILSAGFISVLPSSRVVITESEEDSRVFSAYFQTLSRKNRINYEPPLTFLPASRRNAPGDGGVSEVRKWAPKLSELFQELGFFGLIDRDISNPETDVIKVLKRHSVENYLVDPLTIIAYLIKEGVTSVFENCPITDMNFHRIASLSSSQIQALADQWCVYAQNHSSVDASDERFEAVYLGGFEITLPIWIRDMKGHDLASEMKRVVNSLLASQRRTAFFDASDPFRRVIEIQTTCVPEVISNDFIEIFSGMQARKILS